LNVSLNKEAQNGREMNGTQNCAVMHGLLGIRKFQQSYIFKIHSSACRTLTNARTMKTLISMALDVFNTPAAMIAPCSVKA